jgi:hypothetical protein
MRTTMRLMAAMVLAGLASPALADFSATRQDGRVIVSGPHFRITADAARGGEMADIQLFDGSQWNRLLGGDGQTCPQVRLSDKVGQYTLANDKSAKIEKFEAAADVIRFQTTGKPRTANGKSSPWTVKLSYEVHAEGAVFVDVDYTLNEANCVLTGSSMSLVVDQSVTKAAKYRHIMDFKNVTPENRYWSRQRPVGPKWAGWFPFARVLLGVNPQRSFTNEVEAIVEYRNPMGGSTDFNKGDGRSTWMLTGGKVVLWTPFHYHNRFSLGLGSGVTGMGKPTTNMVAQRGYDWYRTKGDPKVFWKQTREKMTDKPPTDEQIDKMAANGATYVQLQTWALDGPFSFNGHPHTPYVPAFEKEFVQAIAHAHQKGLRVLLYMRGVDRYALDRKFFEKYLKRDWDGLYLDWHGATGVAFHDRLWEPEPAMGDVHSSTDGSQVAVRDYFLFARRLRQVVGPHGFLVGHQGSYNSGVSANLCFDAYYPGENREDEKMFSDGADDAVFAGMMGGGLCTPYPRSLKFRTPEAIAKMAAWGIYPIISLGVITMDKPIVVTSGDADDPSNTYHLGYWRVLKAIDAERATVYNLPSVNQIAATCSQPDFACVVYREKSKTGDAADDAYLVIAANLGPKADQSQITLDPSVLGMSGAYDVARVDPQTGSLSPQGTTTGQLTTTSLPTWGFEGYKLTHKN